MKNIAIIFKREIAAYISSPIVYIFIVFFLILSGVFTFKLSGFFEIGQADLKSFFGWIPWLYLFLIPAISMRLWSEERKSGTIELLFTFPIKIYEAMAGKFLAAWAVITSALLLTFTLPLTVEYLGKPDVGVMIAGYIGSILLSGCYLAIGCFFSASTKNQVISFIFTFVNCLILLLIGFEPFVKFFEGLHLPLWLLTQISNFSFFTHFANIQKGILDVRDIFFFVTFICVSIYCGALILENRKAE
ncbi:MAG: ABC transporter permease [Nitrospirae bacterium]|nr:ABC transporter permease [Nitrospirota bacterium]MBF0542136.1 ABC transporter permease [Nitrospirota bacterium]